jgi:hypothetical protein
MRDIGRCVNSSFRDGNLEHHLWERTFLTLFQPHYIARYYWRNKLYCCLKEG